MWREYVSPFLMHSGGGGGISLFTRSAEKRAGAIERVAIVAHSAGGLVTTHMARYALSFSGKTVNSLLHVRILHLQ